MRPHTTHWQRSLLARSGLVLTAAFAISLVVTACLSPPKPRVVIHEDPRGSVYLEAMPDQSFQATHPISLDPAVIARVLRGVHVQEQQRVLQTLVTGEPIPARAFSDEDTEFLSPRIATALRQAAAWQEVGFRVLRTTALGTETTGGVLFALGRSLHLSLTHYGYNPEKPGQDSKPGRHLPNLQGLDHHRVLFLPPASTQRPEADMSSAFLDSNSRLTIVVDYDRMAKQPHAETPPAPAMSQTGQPTSRGPVAPVIQPSATQPPSTVAPDPHQDEHQAIKNLIIKKDKELEALKKELENIRRRLGEREGEGERRNAVPKKNRSSVP